jgi:hypothetical protein
MDPFIHMELARLRGRELQRQAERENLSTVLTPTAIPSPDEARSPAGQTRRIGTEAAASRTAATNRRGGTWMNSGAWACA